MVSRRRRPALPGVRRPSDHWNEDKEQISLALGSAEYEEYVNDRAGVDDRDFVPGAEPRDEGDERRPDEVVDAPAQPEHTAELAAELAADAAAQRAADALVAERKYRRQMSKATQTGRMVREAMAAAALTETRADDERVRRAARACPMSLPDVQDDGVGPDDYVPRAMRRYLE